MSIQTTLLLPARRSCSTRLLTLSASQFLLLSVSLFPPTAGDTEISVFVHKKDVRRKEGRAAAAAAIYLSQHNIFLFGSERRRGFEILRLKTLLLLLLLLLVAANDIVVCLHLYPNDDGSGGKVKDLVEAAVLMRKKDLTCTSRGEERRICTLLHQLIGAD